MRIYTRSGDDGTTGLLFGGRISKTDIRCEAYGEVDSAVSAMGLARALTGDEYTKDILLKAQRELFTVMSELATDVDNYHHFKDVFHGITGEHVVRLEELIDALKDRVEIPPKFIIPGASAVSGAIDLARSSMRSAERRVVAMHEEGLLTNLENLRYLNRLGDLLFILARYEDRELSQDIVTGTRVS